MDAKLRLDHSLVALETESGVYGLLELRAPEPETDSTRPKLAIALVIDRSGSMAGEKLQVAKSCAGFLAGRITSEDRLAVVAYDDTVSLVAPLQGRAMQSTTQSTGSIPVARPTCQEVGSKEWSFSKTTRPTCGGFCC
jgi:hypothetical protein